MSKKKKNTKSVKNKNVNSTTKVVKKKEVNKKEEVKQNGKLDPEIASLIKIVVGVVIVVGLVYVATMIMNKFGLFDEGYTRPERSETVISYEDAIIGTVFNRKESEYYVVFDEFGEDANQYLYSVLYRYYNKEDVIPIYSVDMSSGFNSSYKGKDSNPSAQKAINIKISGPTLMKVKNGKNVKYIEGVENIEKELLK